MPKVSFLVRRLVISDPMLSRFHSKAVDDPEKVIGGDDTGKVPPGTLIKRGDWFFLTYLKVVKIENFNAKICEVQDVTVDTVRAVQFQIRPDGIMLICGSKREVDEIDDYLGALALEEAGASPDVAEFDLSQYFQINDPIFDLDRILSIYENQEMVDNVPKIKINEFEVAIGMIKRCVINTTDYGGVKKALSGGDESKVTGIQINLKQPKDTVLYYDGSIAQVMINTGKDADESDIQTLTEVSIKILG